MVTIAMTTVRTVLDNASWHGQVVVAMIAHCKVLKYSERADGSVATFPVHGDQCKSLCPLPPLGRLCLRRSQP